MAAVLVKRSIIVLAAEPREEWVQVNCKIPAWRRKKVAQHAHIPPATQAKWKESGTGTRDQNYEVRPRSGSTHALLPHIWKALAETHSRTPTRSGPASLLFSKQKWLQKWHIKGVVELRAEELLSMILEKLKTHGQWETGGCRLLEGPFIRAKNWNSSDKRYKSNG